MHFITGTAADLQPRLIAAMGRYRHQVFIDRLGWQLACADGCETDQFDRAHTVYVLALDAHAQVVGVARLLPTTQPYLLGQVFPELLGAVPMPCSPVVWELSRFSALDLRVSGAVAADAGAGAGVAAGARAAARQFSSPLAVQLLRQALACAAARGARSVVTVSPLAVERLLRRAGFQAQRLAPPVVRDGMALFACSIRCGTPDLAAAPHPPRVRQSRYAPRAPHAPGEFLPAAGAPGLLR